MKVILKTDIESLGQIGEIVEVKRGYARNFLIPQNKAIEASQSNLKSYEQDRLIADKRQEREKKEAEHFSEKLSKVSLTATIQVGEEDKVFGAVTSQNVADLLKEQNIEIDRKKIILPEPIKALGVYDVPIKLHSEVEAIIKVWVVRE